MVLFQDDWGRYPDAIPDYKTSNKSFIDLAAKYKKMGVKNYQFHLALHQPELQGVNPHDKYLSIEIMAKIGLECFRNPWYWFREVVRIAPKGSPIAEPLRANRGNIALYWLFFNHIDVSLIQPRQTGKSVSTDALMLWLLIIGCSHTLINLLTKDDDLRRENVDRIKSMRMHLPEFMRSQHPKDSDNSIEIMVSKRKNRYGTKVSQNSEAAALNVGRGLTAPVTHLDEPPFVSYVDVSIPAMLASGIAVRENAKRAGTPYGTIFTTTAGKIDSRSGKFMYGIIHGGLPWSEHYYDAANQELLEQMVDRSSTGDMPIVNITLSHRQLGYTDEWLYRTMKKVAATGEAADRDFFNRWTSGGLSSPLPTFLNERIKASKREPDWVEIHKDGYVLQWYVPREEIANRMAQRAIILGMDTSDAIGRDNISMVFVDSATLEVIAAAKVNETLIPRFTAWVTDLMIKYQRLIIIPERRGSGQTIIDTLLYRLPAAGIDPFRRVYNLIVDESALNKDMYRQISGDMNKRTDAFYEKLKREFGFATSGSGRHSRTGLYSETLMRAALLGCDKCYDDGLITEITTLVQKNGRIDHTATGHDDMVVGWLLAVWFLTMSKNLQFYGVENALEFTKEARQGVSVVEAKPEPIDHYMEQQQAGIKQEIAMLLETLRGITDDMRSLKIEQRLRVLDQRLKSDYNETQSIAALIDEVKAQRRNTNRERRFKTQVNPTRQSNGYRWAA